MADKADHNSKFLVNCLEHCRIVSGKIQRFSSAADNFSDYCGSVYAYYDSFTYVVYLDGEEVGYGIRNRDSGVCNGFTAAAE